MQNSSRILVVDDSEGDYRLIHWTLAELGRPWQLEWASHLRQARELLAAGRHDLCLLDYHLGRETGLDLLRALREDDNPVPVIVLTGSTDYEVAVAAMKEGAVDYLVKGAIEPAQIERAIRYALEWGEAQRQLSRSEARFRAMFDRATLGIAQIGPGGRLAATNPAMEQMLGYSADELQRLRIRDLQHPDELESSERVLRLLESGEHDSYRGDRRFVRKDGSTLWGHLVLSPVRDDPQAPSFIIAMLEDVTERRELEQQLRQSQKMESIGRLAGGVAHDFNNMLAVINGYADLLLNRREESDPERNSLVQIRKAGAQAAQLTQQLLAFSRKQLVTPRVLDLGKHAADLTTMLQRLIGEDVELVLDAPAGSFHIHADPNQLEQMLVNFAVNARDAMPEGGRLVIAVGRQCLPEDRCVAPETIPAGEYVTLTVLDTGCGIPETILPHIFEPFFTTKESGRGTGLGLSSVYGAVKQNGAFIEVDSVTGRGSRFSVYFPPAWAPEAEEMEVSEAISPQGRETILVVEDERMLRELICHMLEMKGYEVLSAESGNAALEICQTRAGSIDLLLTDVVMPGRSGGQLARFLSARYPHFKILFMSGYTEDAIVRHGVSSHTAHFLPKPFSQSELARKVREVLDQVSA